MIVIRNLYKKFDDKVLFENYNFSIPDGGFVVFCGRSGCGKTTLLNMIGCLEKPDKGTIVIDGIDICKTRKKENYFPTSWAFCFKISLC